ncbi:unnamed protein product [Gordionus sp. m RMFG-2023]|uniref:vacuolar protein sorting-associated protein 18 homolog n=1 Tax=Gordionus sp. m RMFG-2023 TaxID=3053472 RepID=UPI0030DF149E
MLKSNSSLISATIHKEEPIFVKHRINFKPKCKIVAMCVSNNIVILGLEYNVLLRINLKFPEKHEEIDVIKNSPFSNMTSFSVDQGCIIDSVHLNPSATHAIVSVTTGDTLYLHKNSKKLRSLSKIKGNTITCVAWNKCINIPNKSQTGPILLGTSKGTIIETNLCQSEERQLFQQSLELYSKMVLNLSKERETSVVGIEFNKIPNSYSTMEESNKYFVIVTTNNRLYQYIHTLPEYNANSTNTENPFLYRIFSKYDTQPERFHELPGNLSCSRLVFNYRSSDQFPQNIAWFSGSGIFLGKIDCTFRKKEDSVISETRLLPYPLKSETTFLGAVMTSFHLLILYPERLLAINILNQQTILEDTFPKEFGGCVGITEDATQTDDSRLWVFCGKAIFKYRIHKENRDVWKHFLAKADFDTARSFCQENELLALDTITIAEADHVFNQSGDFSRAAKLYSASHLSVHNVALKFYRAAENISAPSLDEPSMYQERIMSGCAEYLKLTLTKDKNKEKTQVTVLVLWLAEIYLSRLSKFPRSSKQYSAILEEFKSFLLIPQIQECLYVNESVLFELIAGHDNEDVYLFFAEHSKDYDKIIRYYVERGSYATALKIMDKQRDAELFYKFSSFLITHIPDELISSWMDQYKKHKVFLKPSLLLPAMIKLLSFPPSSESQFWNEIIKYLEFSVDISGQHNRRFNSLHPDRRDWMDDYSSYHTLDQTLTTNTSLENNSFGNNNLPTSIHNFLISLYCQYQPDQLIKYLKDQGMDKRHVNYDLNYALRMCMDYNNIRACVFVHTIMGLYEPAVRLALKFDIELAKQTANLPFSSRKNLLRKSATPPDSDKSLKKRLWLIIAKDVISRAENNDTALKGVCDVLVNECDALTIEDILPFFPDFQTIDHFKEPVMMSVKDYNSHLKILQEEMEECTKGCDELRADIQEYTDRCMMVRSEDLCSSCQRPLLTSAYFHLFQCLHYFHTVCLVREIKNLLDKESKEKFVLAEKVLKSSKNSSLAQIKEAKAEMEKYVGVECPYCNQLIINSIDRPFIDPEIYEQEYKSWL